ncbi:hypothetical protein D3C80_2126850 [compost metagenome]
MLSLSTATLISPVSKINGIGPLAPCNINVWKAGSVTFPLISNFPFSTFTVSRETGILVAGS